MNNLKWHKIIGQNVNCDAPHSWFNNTTVYTYNTKEVVPIVSSGAAFAFNSFNLPLDKQNEVRVHYSQTNFTQLCNENIGL